MMATSSEPKQMAPRSYVMARQNAVHVPVSPSAPDGNHQPAAAPLERFVKTFDVEPRFADNRSAREERREDVDR